MNQPYEPRCAHCGQPIHPLDATHTSWCHSTWIASGSNVEELIAESRRLIAEGMADIESVKAGLARVKREPLSDDQIDAAQEQAYLALRAKGFKGSMGGLQWDRASARAIEQAHGIGEALTTQKETSKP